jgi:uncharacterized protein YfbU (UPF0304 family)
MGKINKEFQMIVERCGNTIITGILNMYIKTHVHLKKQKETFLPERKNKRSFPGYNELERWT